MLECDETGAAGREGQLRESKSIKDVIFEAPLSSSEISILILDPILK